MKEVYSDLRFRANKIFEPRLKLEVPAISDVDLEAEVLNAYTVTSVYTQELKTDGTFMVVSIQIQLTVVGFQYHILPKSGFSLKVMQEIPILVVLMYQLFKQHIHQDVSDFIPLIMDFINLKPTEEQKYVTVIIPIFLLPYTFLIGLCFYNNSRNLSQHSFSAVLCSSKCNSVNYFNKSIFISIAIGCFV